MKEQKNSTQYEIILEALQTEDIDDVLDAIESGASEDQIARKYFGGYYSKGGDKATFEIDDDTVLKMIRKTAQHPDQLFREVQNCFKYGKNKIVPMVKKFDHRNYRWAIVENVVPCEAEDFEILAGMKYTTDNNQKMKRWTSANGNGQANIIRCYKKGAYEKYRVSPLGGLIFTQLVNSLYIIRTQPQHKAIREYKQYVSDAFMNNRFARDFISLTMRPDFSDEALSQSIFVQNWGIAMRDGEPRLVLLDID